MCRMRGTLRQHCMKYSPHSTPNLPPPQKKPIRSVACHRGDGDDRNVYLLPRSPTTLLLSLCRHIHVCVRPACRRHTLTKLAVVRRHHISPPHHHHNYHPSLPLSLPPSPPLRCRRILSSRQLRSGGAVLSSRSPGFGVLSSGKAAAVGGVDEDQAWRLSEALRSSRQAPDALTYISTVSLREREGE